MSCACACVVERITEEIANEFPRMAFQGRDEAWSTYRTEIPTQVRAAFQPHSTPFVCRPLGCRRLARARALLLLSLSLG